MTPALLIVILIVVALIAFVVLVWRAVSRQEQAAAAYLRELAPRLGATIEREDPARLTGERDGRRFILSLKRTSGQRAQVVETWIEIPVTTTMTLQVERQTSDLGARLAGDQLLDDPEFDATCFLRTNDPDVVRRAFDAPFRTMVAEAYGTGDLRLLVVRNQWLRVELRGALDDPENEPKVTQFLQAALTLAGRLDGSPVSGPQAPVVGA